MWRYDKMPQKRYWKVNLRYAEVRKSKKGIHKVEAKVSLMRLWIGTIVKLVSGRESLKIYVKKTIKNKMVIDYENKWNLRKNYDDWKLNKIVNN